MGNLCCRMSRPAFPNSLVKWSFVFINIHYGKLENIFFEKRGVDDLEVIISPNSLNIRAFALGPCVP